MATPTHGGSERSRYAGCRPHRAGGRQHLALADVVGGADDAFGLHPLDQLGGAVVADLQMALHKARRGLALAAHQRDRLVVQLVARAALLVAAEHLDRRAAVILGDIVDIVRRALRFQERDDALDLLVRHERPVHARDAAAAGHVEHVAAPQQLLGAALAEDRAAVDLRGHLKADAGREIGLDRAGDDIDRRALRRHDQVDAGGPRHLRQALHRRLDLLAGDQHQIGHLVDDDDNQRQFAGVERLFLEDRLAGLGVEPGLHLARQALALLGRLAQPCVEPVDVAHAEPRHLLIAALHLAHRPFQREHRLFRVGDDRRQQMRDAVIDRQFQHLRVDHDEFARGRAASGTGSTGSSC